MRRDWISILSEYKKSNQTQKEFCSSRSLPFSTFQYYRKKQKPDLNKQVPHFIRLNALPESQTAMRSIELHFSDGRFLKLPETYPLSSIRTLLKMSLAK